MGRPRVVSLSELEKSKTWLESETVISVPSGVSQKVFAQSLRKFLGGYPTICRVGDNELYVKK